MAASQLHFVLAFSLYVSGELLDLVVRRSEGNIMEEHKKKVDYKDVIIIILGVVGLILLYWHYNLIVNYNNLVELYTICKESTVSVPMWMI